MINKHLDKPALIALHLHNSIVPSIIDNTLRVKSTLSIILQEARSASVNINTNNIIPLLGAFAVLDQLGGCYELKDKQKYPPGDSNKIRKALYYFGEFDSNEIDLYTLCALRNSLVHDVSLISLKQSSGNPSKKNFWFAYDRNQEQLIQYPKEDWNGNIENLDQTKRTIVNPVKILELAEQCVFCAQKNLQEGNLELIISPDLLKAKYLLVL